MELDKEQQAAITLSLDLKQRIVSVTGPAGSGKTTILKQVVDNVYDNNDGCIDMDELEDMKSVALCAPTGKAARRIKEATGYAAVTIHKLLGYNRPGERDERTGKPLDFTGPKYTAINRMPWDMVIVDEYAMVNYELHNNLIAALPRGGVIRAFGDIHQLPPIEPYKLAPINGKPAPTPFAKILKDFQSVRLDTIYRQGEGSNIRVEADKIRRGYIPTVNKDMGDYALKLTNNPVEFIRQFVVDHFSHGVDFGKIENQIISPGKKGAVGTRQLNHIIRMLLNPNPEQKTHLPRYKWDSKEPLTVGLGDKVVCTENTYDLRNFSERFASWNHITGDPEWHSFIPTPDNKMMLNGETGVVTQIYPDGGLDVDFGDRVVEIPSTIEEFWRKEERFITVSPLRCIDLAFALTTHKCQGSEFDNVCYVMNTSTRFTQSRQNFYTGVTRSKKRIVIATDQTSLRYSVGKVQIS